MTSSRESIRDRPLKYSAQSRIALGYITRKLVRWSRMAHTNDLVFVLSISLSFPHLSLLVSLPPCDQIVCLCLIIAKEHFLFPVGFQSKSFSCHPLIKFRNRSSDFFTSLSAITRKSSTCVGKTCQSTCTYFDLFPPFHTLNIYSLFLFFDPDRKGEMFPR